MKHDALVGALLIVLISALASAARADIYTCTDEHGNVAYLQTPCPVEKAEEPAATGDEGTPTVEAERDEYVPESTPEPRSPEAPFPSSRRPGETLQDCKKRYRDQIDEIDAEIQTGFSPDDGAAYKERLLALTRQLRACSTQ